MLLPPHRPVQLDGGMKLFGPLKLISDLLPCVFPKYITGLLLSWNVTELSAASGLVNLIVIAPGEVAANALAASKLDKPIIKVLCNGFIVGPR